jgi:MarR family transcriptional repressor of mepA
VHTSFENLLCFIIGRTRKVIVRRLNDALLVRNIPVTFDQFIFLYKLSVQDTPVSQQMMADLTGKDKSAILRTITILEKKGLVNRIQDTADKRKNLLSVTKACEALFGQVVMLFDEVNQQLKEGIPESEYEMLVRSLHRIKENAILTFEKPIH